MPRIAFNQALELRQQYLSMVSHKIPGESAWTLLDQGRVLSPSQQADDQSYSRLGDKNKLRVAGQVTTDVQVVVYVENDLQELARILGTKPVGASWAGTEVIQLDPTKIADLKIESFDGITVGATLLFTEYINRFRPMQLTMALDAEGDVRIAELSGAADDYYIIPAAVAVGA